ncbi:MAG: glycosyltransferase [Aquabacterium sp.]|nr:glycosyltransferase [Aquabacterium sp.]
MTTLLSWEFASALASSFAVCAFLVVTQRWHGRFSLDHDLNGVQKIHTIPVPRVGGLGLLLGLFVAIVIGYTENSKTYPTALILLACAAPVFVTGFAEDLTKKISIRTRLLASFVSAAAAIWLLDARLLNLDTAILDALLSYHAVSVLFTVFAVGGVTHSINIIDGLNGLAAGAVSIMLAGLGTLAWMHGDHMVMEMCLLGIAAMGGFMILNYPFGRIFLGDGGAYLAGFWLAECAVLLLVRNPSVSTWGVLLACFYPVWETVFSMYRRRVYQRVNSGNADMGHLHQLVYCSLQTQKSGSHQRPSWLRHGLASATIWGLTLGCQVLALTENANPVALVFGVIGFALIYCLLYSALAPSKNERIPTVHATNG